MALSGDSHLPYFDDQRELQRALAGFLASRAFKRGSPATPELAIEEAKRIRETVTSEHPERTI